MPAMPFRKYLPTVHSTRATQDGNRVFCLRAEVRARRRIFLGRHVYQLRLGSAYHSVTGRDLVGVRPPPLPGYFLGGSPFPALRPDPHLIRSGVMDLLGPGHRSRAPSMSPLRHRLFRLSEVAATCAWLETECSWRSLRWC